ncbi:MAG: FtsX-like permease family protein [Calditrichaeota bacterium]|nr:MAG: FtsX-like permease family protein [Calditrichota bacterium]
MTKIEINAWERIQAHVTEAVREALHTIRNNKMRSGLVILGVLIGVASLMGMVSTIAGLNKFITQSISGNGTPIITVQKANLIAGDNVKDFEKRKNLTVDDAMALRSILHVRGVAVVYGNGMVVKYKNRKAQLVQVAGSNQPLLEVQNINVGEGRYFTEFEEERRRKVVVLGHKTAQSLFPDEDPIGKTLRINGKEYRVVGVFAKRKTIFGGLADNFMVIPYTSYERDFKFRHQPMEMHIIVDSMQNIDQVTDHVRAVLRMRRKVPPGQPDDFSIVTVDAAIEFTRNITDRVGLVLVVLSSIALMVGGIGVMVIMLVSVTERTREIGIRKSIGATRSQITWQFLIESATLSGIGGLLGILIGIIIALVISKLLGFPFILPIGWTIFAVLLSASVGMFFGIFPARKAAKLNPIVALRYE